jgi:protein TonB
MTSPLSPDPARSSSVSAIGTARLAVVCLVVHALILMALVALNRPPAPAEPREQLAATTWVTEPEPDDLMVEEIHELEEPEQEPEVQPEIDLDTPPPPPALPPPPAMTLEVPPLNLSTPSAVVVPTQVVRNVIETTHHFAAVIQPKPEVPPPPKPEPAVAAPPEASPVVLVTPPPPAGPLDANKVDKPPREAVCPSPSYPRLLRRRGASGSVQVQMLIGATGRVERVSVLSNEGSDLFVEAVTDTVRGWRFTPAEHNGKAVSVRASKRFTFQLR